MMKNTVRKMLSLLLTLCVMLGMTAGASAQTADFEVLMPLFDLICAASEHSANAPEKVPGADGQLTASFVDSFISAGQEYGAEVGVTAEMLSDPAAQEQLLKSIFAAQLPQLAAVAAPEESLPFVGFHPVTVKTGAGDGSVQIIGEMYQAPKALRSMEEAEYIGVEWIDRAVFTLCSDASAFGGFRVTGFSVGTDLSYEEAMQAYFEEIAVEYESKLGFMLLYPAAFDDDLLEEDENGVSAVLPDGSASFSAKRLLNTNGAGLGEYVSIIANGIPGSVSKVNEDMQYGTVSYTTAEGRTVFTVYCITDQYVFQAELTYLTELAGEFGMYHAYLENSFVVNELSQG